MSEQDLDFELLFVTPGASKVHQQVVFNFLEVTEEVLY